MELSINEEQKPIAPRFNPLFALLLSAAVLPGLGQILTGAKKKGAIMIGIVTIWLPVALFKLLTDLNKIMPALMEQQLSGKKISFGQVQEMMQPLGANLAWFFLPLFLVWFWSSLDALVNIFKKSESK